MYLTKVGRVIDALSTPELNLAYSTRNNVSEDVKGGKLINLGMEIDGQTVMLLLAIAQETSEKIGIQAQLLPANGQQYLPPNLKLTLRSKAGKILQETQSSGQDNLIQLKHFRGESGKRFSIEVSINDILVREDFEF